MREVSNNPDSSSATTTLDTLPPLADLLDRAGFRIRSRARADCPSCLSHSSVAFTDQVYFCHDCKRTGNRQSLLRELGLLAADPESVARRRAEARETARLQAVAERLRKAEKRVLGSARENLHALGAIWRNASGRLVAVHAGDRERFPGETELAWSALQFVVDHYAHTSAVYFVAAFASEKDRALFALHLDERARVVERLLEDDRWLRTDRGWMEFSL